MAIYYVRRDAAEAKLTELAKSRQRVVLIDHDSDDDYVEIRTEPRVAAPGEQETRS